MGVLLAASSHLGQDSICLLIPMFHEGHLHIHLSVTHLKCLLALNQSSRICHFIRPRADIFLVYCNKIKSISLAPMGSLRPESVLSAALLYISNIWSIGFKFTTLRLLLNLNGSHTVVSVWRNISCGVK